MAAPRRRTLTRKPKDGQPAPPPEPPKPYAAVDLGASAVRLVIAEGEGDHRRIVEEASRGVLLGKDTFTDGRIGSATLEATLRAIEGFRALMDTFGVVRYRAVATSALREASNRDTVLDRIRVRTGIDVEVIDGSEENRLTYLAVREALADHPSLASPSAALVEVGGGSADVSALEHGEPVRSGTYPVGSIRLRQSFAAWQGTPAHFQKLLRRHITNVLDDVARELQLDDVLHVVAQGADVRFAARALGLIETGASVAAAIEIPREPFLKFCSDANLLDVEALYAAHRLSPADAETLGPALLVYSELLRRTAAKTLTVTTASLRHGVIADLARSEAGLGIEAFSRQVLASAHAVGEKYRYDATHGRHVAQIAVRLFDELKLEHGLESRDRLLLEVAALLHDIGLYVNLRGHHKHSQYLISVSEIFGLSREDLQIAGNVARYHRRALPQRSHIPYMALDRETKLVVNKLAAILRVANALDADHQQKVKNVQTRMEAGAIVFEVEGAGDLTMERLALLARGDFFQEAFGRRVVFREGARAES